MAERILLVEDEEKLARMVELELNYEGYQVEKALDGRSGLELALGGGFDLVLLDIMLPQLSGMEVLRRLRRESQVPVIMLTARDSVVDKVAGLDSGALPESSFAPPSVPPHPARAEIVIVPHKSNAANFFTLLIPFSFQNENDSTFTSHIPRNASSLPR